MVTENSYCEWFYILELYIFYILELEFYYFLINNKADFLAYFFYKIITI